MLDPFHSDALDDPFPAYRSVLETPGLPRHERLGMRLVARHRDCREVLTRDELVKDHRHFDAEHGDAGAPSPAPALAALRASWFLGLDPPEHTRLRGAVAAAFTRRALEPLRHWLAERARRQAERLRERATIDLVADFAAPYPLGVIRELLGLIDVTPETLVTWSDAALATTELHDDLATSTEVYRRADLATPPLVAAIRAGLRSPRAGDSTCRRVREELDAARRDGQLTEDEAVSTLALLLLGGYDTTAYALAEGVRRLLADGGAWERLREEPAGIPRAVEEILRIDPSLHRLARVALHDTEIGGHPIARGEWLTVLVGAANRDPAVFSEPERFDIDREPNPHLTLGAGRHYCLGASLVRLELQAALGALLELCPRLRLEPGAVRRPTAMFRGWERLPARPA